MNSPFAFFFFSQLIGRFAGFNNPGRAPSLELSAAAATPVRDATSKGAAAQRAEPRSPGRWRAAWVLGAFQAARWVRPPRPRPREGRAVPARRPGRRERRLLQRPHRRGHAPAAAARLAGAAARLVQHLQLRLGLRRVLLHALDGWCGAGCWSSRALVCASELCDRLVKSSPPRGIKTARRVALRFAANQAHARGGAAYGWSHGNRCCLFMK